MNINFNIIIKQLIPFFSLFLIAYLINSLIYIYLPKSSPLTKIGQEYNIEYKKYLLFDNLKEKQKLIETKIEQKIVEVKKEYKLISNITLKAIYSSSISTNGWIIIAQNNSIKTIMLSVGEMFKEYKLIKVFAKYVIFEKNGKEYKLSMSGAKDEPKYQIIKKQIKKIDNIYSIKREDINLYQKDISKIWKDISIKEIRKDGKIDGFKINRISSKSIFNDLGLKKGDIIKGVNNIIIESYADAFKLYRKLDNTDNLQFTILRDNETMEMEYEIK
ncbi:MAG: hypothetical protein DRG78_06150 [Epsilonproteobacteria bacterium]|nr:MAG: hypothetical protein DRG78_06150 [Campylobacterota bacterium]